MKIESAVHFYITRFILIVIPVMQGSQANMNVTKFFKDHICNVDVRIAKGCSKNVNAGSGNLRCLGKCAREDSCIGASLDVTGKCFLHDVCPHLETCTGNDEGHEYWARYCVCGHWDSRTGSCKCVNGSTGVRCERYPDDCRGLQEAGYAAGHYWIHIDPFHDGRQPFRVLCRIYTGHYRYVYIAYNPGGINFNRTWDEFENGFDSDLKTNWIGLKTWHALSTVGFDLLYVFLKFKGTETVNVFCELREFRVSGANTKYNISYERSITRQTGPVPGSYRCDDCMQYAKGLPFSTWDNDNDGDNVENCASRAGSGWWYSGCDNKFNLLGWGLDDWEGTPEVFNARNGHGYCPWTNC